MQVELLEAKTETFGPLGRRRSRLSAATSPGTGLAYGLRRVCAAWGMARSSFYAMTSGQHAEQPPARLAGPKPAISDQALLVAIEADLDLGGRGLPQGLGSASGLSRHPGCPQAGAPPDAREQFSRPIAAAAAAIPMTVRCPEPLAFGCSRWTTAGSSPPSSIGADLRKPRRGRAISRIAITMSVEPIPRRPQANAFKGEQIIRASFRACPDRTLRHRRC